MAHSQLPEGRSGNILPIPRGSVRRGPAAVWPRRVGDGQKAIASMVSSIFYLGCVLGIATAALYLLVRPGKRGVKLAATVVGLGALGWLVQQSTSLLDGDPSDRPGVFFFVFSLIAVASAVRMITHSRPIYSALYFVMVVLSSAGLFLLLEAEFMAFALVIVYAGAILITYLFVLMLAQQAGEDGAVHQPEYDRVPREPAAGALVGFVMLALLSEMIFTGVATELEAPSVGTAQVLAWRELEQMPVQLRSELIDVDPELSETLPTDGPVALFNRLDGQGAVFIVDPAASPGGNGEISLPHSALPQNIQRVGWALVHQFPASLELAGVILLMAMFGAVVLAQRQIELSEEEKRLAAQSHQAAKDAANGGSA